MADVRAPEGASGSAPEDQGNASGGSGDSQAELPEGRYGRRSGNAGLGVRDARTDRQLKIVGGVLGALALAVIVWIGVGYVTGQSVSAQVIGFHVDSAHSVRTHLEVRKDAGAKGVCTVRTRAESGEEVGRKDLRVAGRAKELNEIVTVRTTSRATSADLVGCRGTHGR